MKKFKITSTPNTSTTEAIVWANTEDEAFEYWLNDENDYIITETNKEHDDGYLKIEVTEEE